MRVGRAGSGFPWPWTVVRWFDGRTALDDAPRDLRTVAAALGRFFAALHQPAPDEAPENQWRSIPLDARSERLHEHLDLLKGLVDRERVLTLWYRVMAVPRWSGPRLWIHGDMHPGNLLLHDGALSAVLDFGDLTAGDPATDLSVMWMLLPSPIRPFLFAACGRDRSLIGDDHVWIRARGWALALGLAYMAHAAGDDALGGLGRRTIDAALTGD